MKIETRLKLKKHEATAENKIVSTTNEIENEVKNNHQIIQTFNFQKDETKTWRAHHLLLFKRSASELEISMNENEISYSH